MYHFKTVTRLIVGEDSFVSGQTPTTPLLGRGDPTEERREVSTEKGGVPPPPVTSRLPVHVATEGPHEGVYLGKGGSDCLREGTP